MSEPTSSAAGFMLYKLYGIKACIGMLGAAILYMAMPPVDKDGSFNEREFVFRLVVAGFFSMTFGDWAVDVIDSFVPSMLFKTHPTPIYLLVGAPGWWVSRVIALWLKRHEKQDLAEVIKEIKSDIDELKK